MLTGLAEGQGLISKVYKNNGDNTFSEESSITLQGTGQGTVVWGDYNNDGYLDLFISGNSAWGLYKNEGGNTFTLNTSLSSSGMWGIKAQWADYDNDGYLDLVIIGRVSDYEIKVFHNNGDETFTEQNYFPDFGVGGGTLSFGDFDNDYDLDLLISGGNGIENFTKIFRNNNINTNTLPTLPTNLLSTVNGQEVTLDWDKCTDVETPQNGLKYNLVIGTTQMR